MNSFGISDKGKIREVNQDSFKLLTKNNVTFGVVCDGVGGHKAGEVASKLAVEYISEEFNKSKELSTTWLKKAIQKVNNDVFQQSLKDEALSGMGTTLVCFIVKEDETIIGNVGDSRCYIVDENGKLIQITNDHTLYNDLVKNKGISEELASKIVGKNVIDRAIGINGVVDGDTFVLDNTYKSIVICSDGLHGYVEETKIEKILNNDKDAQQQCLDLVELTNKAGGFDNITVVIYQR